MIRLPRLKRSEVELTNKPADNLLKDAMDIPKNQLDNVILQYQLTNPVFQEGYLKARVIVD